MILGGRWYCCPMDIMDAITDLPLKEMGEALLVAEIQTRVKNSDDVLLSSSTYEVDKAIKIAAYLHRTQTRQVRGHLPKDTYITHPLRNTLRLLRYGVTDPVVIISSILHDVVEDCSKEFSHLLAGFDSIQWSEERCRLEVFKYLINEFGMDVAVTVAAVTNDPIPKGNTSEQNRKIYEHKVLSAIADRRAAAVKLADLVDNALSLYHHHKPGDKLSIKRANKYLPVLPALIARIQEPDMIALLTQSGMEKALGQIMVGMVELKKIAEEEVGK